MKIYKKLIPNMARDIITILVDAGDVEVPEASIREAEKDIESILTEYHQREADLNEFAKELLNSRGWSSHRLPEARKLAAAARKLPLDDEALDYLINQMLEFMLISKNFEEVFAEDHVMRKRIVGVIRQHLRIDAEVEEEVRKKLRHLEEGTRDWDVAYKKTLEDVRRLKGL